MLGRKGKVDCIKSVAFAKTYEKEDLSLNTLRETLQAGSMWHSTGMLALCLCISVGSLLVRCGSILPTWGTYKVNFPCNEVGR